MINASSPQHIVEKHRHNPECKCKWHADRVHFPRKIMYSSTCVKQAHKTSMYLPFVGAEYMLACSIIIIMVATKTGFTVYPLMSAVLFLITVLSEQNRTYLSIGLFCAG